MKIMFCIPSLGSGGAERVVSVLSNKFVERGLEVSLLLLSKLQCEYPLDEKVEVKCINCAADKNLPFSKRFARRLQKIREATKEIAPDVVISFMAETNIDVCLALSSMRIPVIVSERNDPKIDPASFAKKIMRKLAYYKPRGFVFQTPDAEVYFPRRIRKKARIILNPLNEQLPAPCFDKEKEKRIVAVGRLHKQKNFKLLIDAFAAFQAAHNDYILEIYGEGRLEAEIEQYIEHTKMQDKVFLKGFCKNVHENILSASMFVLSSDYEGMPNALLEAMAIGLPCISTDCPCGGPRVLIQSNQNGILVPVGNQKALTEAMQFMVENPDEAEKMAQNAAKIRNRANVDTITDGWMEFISACLEVK